MAPFGSVTVPDTEPVDCPSKETALKHARSKLALRLFMKPPRCRVQIQQQNPCALASETRQWENCIAPVVQFKFFLFRLGWRPFTIGSHCEDRAGSPGIVARLAGSIYS